MMAASSILKILAEREANGRFERRLQKRLSSCLRCRCVSLSQVMDSEGKIAQGHVLLGFSGCGHYLISYCCEVTMIPPTTFYRYTIHWWYFDLYKKLCLVATYDLFRDELISQELHLIVCQSIDQHNVIVLGCRGSHTKDDEQRTCYVTILPRPPHPPRTTPTPNHSLSVHFKYEILSPFPSFIPALSLKMPGIVIVNTVDSLLAVSYKFTFDGYCSLTHRGRGGVLEAVPQSPPSAVGSHSSPGQMESVLSPGHVLQVEIYHRDQPLLTTHQNSVSAVVKQSRLDIELWLNSVLGAEIKSRGLDYRSLIDYDLQLYEVDSEKGDVKFAMIVLVEASQSTKSVYTSEVVGLWNVSNSQGQAQLVYMSVLEPAQPMVTINWKRTLNLALQLRKACYLPRSIQHTVRAFSNHNVYTVGKSVEALSHPHLPVQLVLSAARKARHTSHRS